MSFYGVQTYDQKHLILSKDGEKLHSLKTISRLTMASLTRPVSRASRERGYLQNMCCTNPKRGKKKTSTLNAIQESYLGCFVFFLFLPSEIYVTAAVCPSDF